MHLEVLGSAKTRKQLLWFHVMETNSCCTLLFILMEHETVKYVLKLHGMNVLMY